jgi:hypothetical protein
MSRHGWGWIPRQPHMFYIGALADAVIDPGQ